MSWRDGGAICELGDLVLVENRKGDGMECVFDVSIFAPRGSRTYQLKRALSWATRPPLVLVKRPKDELVMSVEAKLVKLV